MEPQLQNPAPVTSGEAEAESMLVRAASYAARTISRPPWIGLVLLCVGSMIFELTLFALLPLTQGTGELLSMRLLVVAIAATPALAAVTVAVAANRKSPLVPKIGYPGARMQDAGTSRSGDDRWSEYHD